MIIASLGIKAQDILKYDCDAKLGPWSIWQTQYTEITINKRVKTISIKEVENAILIIKYDLIEEGPNHELYFSYKHAAIMILPTTVNIISIYTDNYRCPEKTTSN